jgi:hypothetical protein
MVAGAGRAPLFCWPIAAVTERFVSVVLERGGEWVLISNG